MNPASVTTKLGKIALNQAQAAVVAVGRLFGVYDFPVPPNSSMRKTSSTSIRHYYLSGAQTALPIMTCALANGVGLRDDTRILDFGCGVGRQLLHFTRRFPRPKYYGCDIDESSIAFVARSYPSVEVKHSGFTPPLDWDDAFFDMVYAVSVFSHLAQTDQVAWLAELARMVRPGGYCFLTTEGFTAVSNLAMDFGAEEEELASRLRDRGVLYREYDYLAESVEKQDTLKVTSLLVGVEGTYGSTLIAPDYIRDNWNTDNFQVVDVVEGIVDFRQDLVVLRRKDE